MTRTFQDDDLLLWEAYAAAPRSGEDHGARIVFHCLTDRTRRARVLEQDSSRSGIEQRLTDADDEELAELLDAAEPIR
ncbi:MAG: hypothetical protein R3314_04230 [Longimicrobiales bacterium]|nr:hypothetical protein [Longimicrobiales bacterium]